MNSHDVARRAGVSQTTVSRVLNGSDKVRPGTRDRVMTALTELGYVPNAQARAMRTNRAGAIGVVASEITNPFFPMLLDALSRETRRRGLRMIFWNDDDPAAEAAHEGVARGTVDGVCFVSARSELSGVQALIDRGVPVVLVNRGLEDAACDQVTSDNATAGRMAAEYLIGRGRRRIAAIFGARNINTGPEREHGFRARLAESDVTLPAEWTHHGPSEFRTGYEGVSRIAGTPEPPDTYFCNSDPIAFGAISALRSRGARLPEDVWLMSIDGLPMAEWEVFDLTTISQPIDDMAREAIDVLDQRIQGSTAPFRRLHLPVTPIARGTTANQPF